MPIGQWAEVAVAAGGPATGTSGHENLFVYDPSVDLALIYDASGNQTWSWDGITWVLLASTPGLGRAMMVYDEGNQQIVLFGGTTSNNTYIWNWGTDSWDLQSPATSPTARRAAAIAYDTTNGEVVMFGGRTGVPAATALDETWVWNGTTWTQRTPTHKPSARSGMSMAYDTVNGNIVLYGGRTTTNTLPADTWIWDGTDWTQVFPAHDLGSRETYGMCWDGFLANALIYGGNDGTARQNDTWAWDGADWTNLTSVVNGTPTPDVSLDVGMCYFTSRREATLVMGTTTGGVVDGDTWVLAHSLALVQVMRWW